MGVQQVPQEQHIIVTVELAPEGASDTWVCDIRWCSGGSTASQLELDCAEEVFEGLACQRDSYPE